MSADNYISVKRFSDGYGWAMGFMSSDQDEMGDSVAESDYGKDRFPTAEDAVADARSKESVIEYGFVFAKGEDSDDSREFIDSSSGMTRSEGECMEHLMRCLGTFRQMQRHHPDEMREFVEAVHKIQDLIALRIVRRMFPEEWPIKAS